jgi:hypothetical protein
MARKRDDLAAELDRLHAQRSLEPSFTYIVIVDMSCHRIRPSCHGGVDC